MPPFRVSGRDTEWRRRLHEFPQDLGEAAQLLEGAHRHGTGPTDGSSTCDTLDLVFIIRIEWADHRRGDNTGCIADNPLSRHKMRQLR